MSFVDQMLIFRLYKVQMLMLVGVANAKAQKQRVAVQYGAKTEFGVWH